MSRQSSSFGLERGPRVVKGDVMARALSERPDLTQLRRQAKELHREAAAGVPDALARVHAVSPQLFLSAAQLALAREYGFASWPRLKAEVDRRRCIHLGDVEGLARLVAADPTMARDTVRSCLSPSGASALGYVGVGRFHGRFDHQRVGELTRVLLAAGAPVDGTPEDAETPLITAASYGEVEMARVLIDAGADLEATGHPELGGTALGHAINFGMTDIVDLLVAAGANIRDIVDAAGAGTLDGFLTPTATDRDKARALQAAAVCERLEAIDELLAAGTRVDAEVDGATALHAAAMNGKARSVAHLLARGADPNRLDAEYHSTPLGWCWHRLGGWGPADGCAEVERLLEPITDGDWVHEEIRVHRAELADAPAVAAVLAAAFAEHRAEYTAAAYAATVVDGPTIAARFDEGPVWVAVRSSDVIGTISAVPDGSTLHLRSMAVVPLARGLGVGDLLINRATEWALPTGFDRLTLDTTPFLVAARRLYERHGFVIADQPARDLHGTPLVSMVQDLASIREEARGS
jgi:GNAT superfamily N-acetyltransferase